MSELRLWFRALGAELSVACTLLLFLSLPLTVFVMPLALPYPYPYPAPVSACLGILISEIPEIPEPSLCTLCISHATVRIAFGYHTTLCAPSVRFFLPPCLPPCHGPDPLLLLRRALLHTCCVLQPVWPKNAGFYPFPSLPHVFPPLSPSALAH